MLRPNIGILGELTHTHQAVLRVLGKNRCFKPYEQISLIFEALAGFECDLAFVPIQNSAGWAVAETVTALGQWPVKYQETIEIGAEFLFPISQCLIVNPGTKLTDIKAVYSHPQALIQTRRWRDANIPNAKAESTVNTSFAAKTIIGMPERAAIGTQLIAESLGLEVLAEDIQDAENITRFVILSNGRGKVRLARFKRSDINRRLSLVFATKDEPGSLQAALVPLSILNLTLIQSLPYPGRPWEALFYTEAAAKDISKKTLQIIIRRLQEKTEAVWLLGIYPSFRF